MAFNQEETAWIVEEMSEKGVGKGQPEQRPSGRVHRRAESTGKKDPSLQGHTLLSHSIEAVILLLLVGDPKKARA